MSPEYTVVLKITRPNLSEAASAMGTIAGLVDGVVGLSIEEVRQSAQVLHSSGTLSYEERLAAYKRRGEIISINRQRLGLTQDQLATQVGVRLTTISKYESGNEKGSIPTITAIADSLGIPEDDPIRAELLMGAARSSHRKTRKSV